MSLDISKIKWYPAPHSEYHRVEFKKNQIVIHHTASGGNSKGDIDFLNRQAGKVHVAFWIDRNGQIWQAFSSRFYAAHLGTPTSTFRKFKVNNSVEKLHQQSVGIELDSWGWLEQGGFTNATGKWVKREAGKFYSYTGSEVKAENVVTYEKGFLGKKYYEKYYEPQISALKDLLEYLCKTYSITPQYKENMWKVSKNALSGESGIWTHISFRESGKWDIHPQKEVINMLKSLK
jgi:N-acetyl-anhydromuramyl-L-alanine amidase AmpD